MKLLFALTLLCFVNTYQTDAESHFNESRILASPFSSARRAKLQEIIRKLAMTWRLPSSVYDVVDGHSFPVQASPSEAEAAFKGLMSKNNPRRRPQKFEKSKILKSEARFPKTADKPGSEEARLQTTLKAIQISSAIVGTLGVLGIVGVLYYYAKARRWLPPAKADIETPLLFASAEAETYVYQGI